MAVETTQARTVADGAVTELREAVRGAVIGPADPDYDSARAIWNGYHDRRPQLVVRCSGVADVRRAIEFGRSEGLDLAVRGGGHSIPGFSTVDGGLVVDLSPMRGIRVDPRAKRATAQGGCTWADFDHETQAFALAVTGGLISSTGIAGFTLGGGIGHLMRRYGLACDNLVAADVVTADGELVRASDEENPELLWGLRGGGGNFGVVTSFEYSLYDVGPIVFGGAIFFAGERAAEVLRFYRDWTAGLPDEVTTLVNLTTAPPVPFLPAEVHGRPIAIVIGAYAGATEDGEAAFAGVKRLGDPVADLLGPLPYTALQGLVDPLWGPGARNHMRSGMLSGLDDAAIDTMAAAHATQPGDVGEIHVHHFGGAVARVPADATAVGDRSAPYVLNVIGRWSDPRADSAMLDWSTELHRGLAGVLTGRGYVNYAGDAGTSPETLYGEKVTRLRELKRRWDPENVFRLNQNIPPAEGPPSGGRPAA
jgi:FAD/FMN-containing dehydrogenase